jgi:hypothetical protein
MVWKLRVQWKDGSTKLETISEKEAYSVQTAEYAIANKLEIDAKTGTNYWREALDLEMKNVRVAFDVLDDKDEIPVGYHQIRGHLIL